MSVPEIKLINRCCVTSVWNTRRVSLAWPTGGSVFIQAQANIERKRKQKINSDRDIGCENHKHRLSQCCFRLSRRKCLCCWHARNEVRHSFKIKFLRTLFNRLEAHSPFFHGSAKQKFWDQLLFSFDFMSKQVFGQEFTSGTWQRSGVFDLTESHRHSRHLRSAPKTLVHSGGPKCKKSWQRVQKTSCRKKKTIPFVCLIRQVRQKLPTPDVLVPAFQTEKRILGVRREKLK